MTYRSVPSFAVVLCFNFLTCIRAFAQEAIFFHLEGEGTATAYISTDTHTAYVADGGKGGSAGIAGAQLDGKSVLKALRDRQVDHLVIMCSHPHRDHMAGLVEMVSNDALMEEFSKVTFVDSGSYAGTPSLHDLYADRLAERGPRLFGKVEQTVEYLKADNRDVLSHLSDATDGVRASNFVYDPGTADTPHGRTIVGQYTLQKNGAHHRVIDFDDAESDLVRKWADWALLDPEARRPDTIIAPHHGSRYTDISPLLRPEIRPRSVVFSVNPHNMYGHPAPETLLKCIDAVGLENVHFTGAAGGIIVTAERGLPPVNDSEILKREYLDFVYDQRVTTHARWVELQERAAAETLSPAEKRQLKQLADNDKALTAIEVKMVGSKRAKDLGIPPTWATETKSPGNGGPFHPRWEPPTPPGTVAGAHPKPSPGSPPAGTGEYAELRQANESFIRESLSHAAGAVGTAAKAAAQIVEEAPRAARFGVVLGGEPILGGIVVGNAASLASDIPVTAEFISGPSGQPVIRLTVKHADATVQCLYDNVTATELVAAYHFVSPSQEMTKADGVKAGDVGLVGLTGRSDPDVWNFGVHPAIANTPIAVDAMRTDMLLSGIAQGLVKFWGIDTLALPDFATYQWYDAPSVITADGGHLIVRPKDGPQETLLRVRFWGAQPSLENARLAKAAELAEKWGLKGTAAYEVQKLVSGIVDDVFRDQMSALLATTQPATAPASQPALRPPSDKEIERRFREAAQERGLAKTSEFTFTCILLEEFQSATADSRTDDQHIERIRAKAVRAHIEGTDVYRLWRIETETERYCAAHPAAEYMKLLHEKMVSEHLDKYAGSRLIDLQSRVIELVPAEINLPWDQSHVTTLVRRFDALRTVDRFARVVAILNWLQDNHLLPPLAPNTFQPVRFPVEPRLAFDEVDGAN